MISYVQTRDGRRHPCSQPIAQPKARECIDLAIESCEAGKERPGCWLRLDTVKTGSLPDDHWHTQVVVDKEFTGCEVKGVRE